MSNPCTGTLDKTVAGPAREKLRILILDNHAVVRRGVRQILTGIFDCSQFGVGTFGSESLDLALGEQWDLVVIAIDLPDRQALDLLTELNKKRPDQPILVFTGRVKFQGAVGAVTAGPEDNVEMATDPQEGSSAAPELRADGPSIQLTMAAGAPPGAAGLRRGRPTHGSLSIREREVLRLLGAGKTVKEIAARLELSEKTISTYRNRVLFKLGLKTTAELVRHAVIHRLAD